MTTNSWHLFRNHPVCLSFDCLLISSSRFLGLVGFKVSIGIVGPVGPVEFVGHIGTVEFVGHVGTVDPLGLM